LKVAVERNLASALRELVADPALSPSGTAEMSLAVNVRSSDHYVLTVERDTASSAFVRLERLSGHEKATVFRLGATVEIKGLRDQIVNRIGELLPDRPEVRQALAKLDALVATVDNDGLRKRLEAELAGRFDDHAGVFELLLGNTPVDEVKEQIVAELSGALEDRVSERVNLLADDAAEAASTIAADVAAAVGLDAETASALHSFLDASLRSALEDLQAKLDGEIERLSSTSSAEIEAILEPFADVSKTVQDALESTGKTTAAALNRVRSGIDEVYTKYTAFRQKLVGLVRDRVTEQAAFSFMKQKVEHGTDTTLLSFRILDADADGVADLYSAIWSRRLDDAWDLLARAKASAGITPPVGSYVSVLENQRRAVLSLNLFGLKVGTDVMFREQVAVGVDESGKLVVAETAGALAIARRRNRESQAFSAEWSFELLDLDPTLVPPVKITIEVADKKLRKNDLRDFFASLDKLVCVKPDAFDIVATELLGGASSRKKVEDVKLALVVALTWDDVGAILGRRRDGTPRADKWVGAEVVRELFAAVARGHKNPNHFADLTKAAKALRREPLALLLRLGAMLPSKIEQDHPRLLKYRALGRSLGMLDEHVATLQEKWAALLDELDRPIGRAGVRRRQRMIEEVDAELRAVLVALFLSNTFGALPDPSEVWQAAAGARVLLDRARREHLLLTVEAPQIPRRMVG
jgi:hypothetical protein